MILKVTIKLDVAENKWPSSYLNNSEIYKQWIQDAIYDQLEDGEDLLSCEVKQLKTAEVEV